MKDTTKAYIAITIQSLITGLSFLFVKIALESADTFTLLAHRFTIAAIGMVIYKLLRPNSIKIEKSDWKKIVPFSFAYPIIFFLFQTLGLKFISSSEAGIVQAIAPILTLIAARIILKEEIKNTQKLSIVLSVAGVIFINVMKGFNPGSNSFMGFLFILLSACAFATYNVLTKKLSKEFSVSSIVYVMSITGCIVFNLIAISMHLVNGTITSYFSPFSNSSFVVAILYLGLLSSIGTSMLSTYALGRLQATKVGLFANLATVVTILAGVVFLHETLYYYHYIGIAAILIGTISFNIVKGKATS